jgi:hypothetical protein
MTREQMETAIEDLPDPQWRLMKEAFYGSLQKPVRENSRHRVRK